MRKIVKPALALCLHSATLCGMDPETTLGEAEYLMTLPRSRSNTSEIREMLSHYWHWRGRGGFEPDNGDARAKAIAEKLGG